MYFLASAKNFSSAVDISKGTGLSCKCFPCSLPVSSEDELENGHQACAGSSNKQMKMTATAACCRFIVILKVGCFKINKGRIFSDLENSNNLDSASSKNSTILNKKRSGLFN